MQQPFIGQQCENCKYGFYIETNDGGDWWLSCNECGALHFCYDPMDHQADFHADNHKFKAFFGKLKSAEVKHDKIGETLTA